MKTKYIISLMVLLIALSFQSCDDFLKEENLSNMTAEDFYLSKDGYTSLVYSVYPEWKQIYGRTDPWLFFAGTDIYVIGVEHGGPIDLQRYSTLNPGSEGIELHYKQCFKIIQRTNMALYYSDLTDKSNPDLDKFIGEMKFHRAFAYFLLVQGYGGVPKIDYYVADAVTSLERASAEEIYELIVKDLEAALVKLPDIAYPDAQGRIVKRAAQHLLAKVYLTRGYEDFGSNDDFTKAAQLADQAITGQGLDIPFAELWEPGNEFNAEVLFSIQYSTEVTAGNPNNGNNQASTIGGGSYMGGGNETVHKDGICVPSRYCYSLFEEGDERWEGTFMTEQYVRYRDFWEDTPDRSKKPRPEDVALG
jgi:starch-binding outer membrane protein, SusD/RagB family